MPWMRSQRLLRYLQGNHHFFGGAKWILSTHSSCWHVLESLDGRFQQFFQSVALPCLALLCFACLLACLLRHFLGRCRKICRQVLHQILQQQSSGGGGRERWKLFQARTNARSCGHRLGRKFQTRQVRPATDATRSSRVCFLGLGSLGEAARVRMHSPRAGGRPDKHQESADNMTMDPPFWPQLVSKRACFTVPQNSGWTSRLQPSSTRSPS